MEHELYLDPALRNWVLLPILAIMIIVGILRSDIALLIEDDEQPVDMRALREVRIIKRAALTREHGNFIPKQQFNRRRDYLLKALRSTEYLKEPESAGRPPNPLDTGNVNQMASLMRGNLLNMIPQTVLMTWINSFFSGFVLLKLPFPMTDRLKPILQSGVVTQDLSPKWVSSLSWYFLTLFGLQPIFNMIIGADNNILQREFMSPDFSLSSEKSVAMGQNASGLMEAEADNLEIARYDWLLDDVADRVLEQYE